MDKKHEYGKKRYIMLSNKRIENLTELTSDDAHIPQNFGTINIEVLIKSSRQFAT